MERMIIGLSGAMGSGKDTAGLIIRHAYPDKHFVHVSFADALKKAYSVMTGIPWVDTEKFKQEECPVLKLSRREILQRIGTNALRNNFDKDIWINILSAKHKNENLIITDVRFDNEVSWIKKEGGLVIKIERTDEVAKSIYAYHESEQVVSRYDFLVKNDTTSEYGFDNFKKDLLEICTIFLGKPTVKQLPKQHESVVDMVDAWLNEFRVHQNDPQENTAMYMDLVKEELRELSEEKFRSRKWNQELCDVVWVSLALALCNMDKHTLKSAMQKLYESNMTKAVEDKAIALAWGKEHGASTVVESKSGRFICLKDVTGKIAKGPEYKPFSLEGIF